MVRCMFFLVEGPLSLIKESGAKLKSPHSRIHPCFIFLTFFHNLWRILSCLVLGTYMLTIVYVLLLISHTRIMCHPWSSKSTSICLKVTVCLMVMSTPFVFVDALAETICGNFLFVIVSALWLQKCVYWKYIILSLSLAASDQSEWRFPGWFNPLTFRGVDLKATMKLAFAVSSRRLSNLLVIMQRRSQHIISWFWRQ